MLRAMHEHHDRHLAIAARHDEPPGKASAGAFEGSLGHGERDALPRRAIERDLPRAAIPKRHMLAVRPIGPAQRADPVAIPVCAELAGRAVLASPAQVPAVGGADVNESPVLQPIDADMAVLRRIARLRAALRGEEKNRAKDRTDHFGSACRKLNGFIFVPRLTRGQGRSSDDKVGPSNFCPV